MLKISGARRIAMLGAMILVASSLPACTTVEGTNALVDIGTFEREVGQETLKGIGVLERESKEPMAAPRGLLALPKSGAEVPPPSEETEYAMLPENSDRAKIDSTGLSEEQLARIRKIIVFDGRADSGRKLTDAEIAQFTRNVEAGLLRVNRDAAAPLWVPDDSYFTSTYNGQEAVCLAPNGDLVSLTDPACPPEIRAQLQKS